MQHHFIKIEFQKIVNFLDITPDDVLKTMSQNEKNEIIKEKNDNLDEIIDKSKSFEEQIESLKKEI